MERNKLIILASQSPRRKEILTQVGIPFDSIPSHSDETIPPNVPYADIPALLAARKALSVSEKEPDRLVFAFDTLVFLDENPMSKPANKDDAHAMLSSLSDREHEVITGIAVAKNGTILEKDREITRVFFKKLMSEEIDNYIITKEPNDKAGSYAIQGKGAAFVKKVEGCYYNVVGLPIYKTLSLHSKFSELMHG
ncbi:MAG: Maf family protein [Fibrobacterales bacterium]